MRGRAELRAHGRPQFLELGLTYRMRGHYEPETSRTRRSCELGPVAATRSHQLASTRLVAEGAITPAGLAAMSGSSQPASMDAAEFAQASPWPSLHTLTEHVYA